MTVAGLGRLPFVLFYSLGRSSREYSGVFLTSSTRSELSPCFRKYSNPGDLTDIWRIEKMTALKRRYDESSDSADASSSAEWGGEPAGFVLRYDEVPCLMRGHHNSPFQDRLGRGKDGPEGQSALLLALPWKTSVLTRLFGWARSRVWRAAIAQL